ncbi:MAG TPA: YicC/YloC family endoribonuclease [Nevskiaceae bacterium]|nr:YicC/YloC family endoribonuclease [Nevskiaceae bacterium]
MIRSMTGFARAEAQTPQGRLSWELRSVNHRYLDLTFKLPEEFRAIENDLRGAAAARVGRGKMESALRHTRDGETQASLTVDTARLSQLKAALEVVAVELKANTEPDPLRVLSFPGIVQQAGQDFAPLQQAALKLFEQALAEFSAMREREGARLVQMLRERCDGLETLVGAVRKRYPLVRDQWVEKLRARCSELGVEVEPTRLAQEIALAAQRLDVDEELSRLVSHLTEIRSVVGKGESVGRRLDFLMQELNREANTLSSKSQDAEMTRSAVEMKVLIEQMREQVQNIE